MRIKTAAIRFAAVLLFYCLMNSSSAFQSEKGIIGLGEKFPTREFAAETRWRATIGMSGDASAMTRWIS